MKKYVGAAVLLAGMVLFSTAAGAVSLSLAGLGYQNYTLGSTGIFDLDNMNANYSTLTGGKGVDGDIISVLYAPDKNSSNGLMVDGPAKVTYTFLGREADYATRLRLGMTTVLGINSNFGDTSLPYNVVAGLLPFNLSSNGKHYVYNNGSAVDKFNVAENVMNIAYLKLRNTSWLVLLDDNGAGPDYDFDDIGVRVDVAAVPLPAALPLLGAGLGVLAMLGRRRRKLLHTTTAPAAI